MRNESEEERVRNREGGEKEQRTGGVGGGAGRK